MRFKSLKTTLFAVVVAVSLPSVINAQETREPARAEDRRDGIDLGWLGLLGLAGLMGLKRRDRDNVVRDRDRAAANTR